MAKLRESAERFVLAVALQAMDMPGELRPALLARLLRQSALPAVAEYAAAARYAPGLEAEFLEAARAEWSDHPAEWNGYLREEAGKDRPDGPVRRAAALLMGAAT